MAEKNDMLARFQAWLRRSGIRYSLLFPGNPLLGTEMIDVLNPLDCVIEHPEYPMARIYRGDFWEGMEDTFGVLIGNHYDAGLIQGHARKGVIDLLIFPIISRRLLGFVFDPENRSYYLVSFRVVAAIVGFLLEIPRVLIAIALTLALSPIVAGVHIFAYFKMEKFEKEMRKFEKDILRLSDHPCYSSKYRSSNWSSFMERYYARDERATRYYNYLKTAPIEEKYCPGIDAYLRTNTYNILNRLTPAELRRVQEEIKNPPRKKIREALAPGFSSGNSNKIYSLKLLSIGSSLPDTGFLPKRTFLLHQNADQIIVAYWKNEDNMTSFRELGVQELGAAMIKQLQAFFPARSIRPRQITYFQNKPLINCIKRVCLPSLLANFANSPNFDPKLLRMIFTAAGCSSKPTLKTHSPADAKEEAPVARAVPF